MIRGAQRLLAPGGGAADVRRNLQRVALVAGAMIGFVVCMPTVMSYSTGVFIRAFQNQYGWGRADLSLCWSLFTLMLFLGSTPAGRLADAFGARRVATASMVLFGAAMFFAPLLVHDLRSLLIAYAVITTVGLGTSPVVILKPVVAAFTTRRGLAVGLAVCGAGASAMFTPLFANALIAAGGWQHAFRGFGIDALLIAPILWLCLGLRVEPHAVTADAQTPGDVPGVSLTEAYRLPRFWVLSGVSLLGAAGVAGILVHLVSFLGDLGKSARDAAQIASILGVASIVGRVTSGLLLDYIAGPSIGLITMSGGVVGVLLLVVFGTHLALPGVFLIGCTLGAELNIVAYFVSRYFGLRAHSAIFGWNYSLTALGGMASPYLTGLLYERYGNYQIGFLLLLVMLALSGALCLLLGPYRYGARVDRAAP